jgi:D-glycero-D-manno-heptose 1,7-bisphosphate phosphatase
LPGVIEALRALQSYFFIVIVTNQSGIARGLLSENDLAAIHLELVRRLAVDGAILDALYYCPHLPEAIVDVYGVDCDCRKPKPGMLLRAKHDWGLDMRESFLVGDRVRDIEAGQAAGVSGILLNKGKSTVPGAHGVASDLAQAARLILGQLGKPMASHRQAS